MIRKPKKSPRSSQDVTVRKARDADLAELLLLLSQLSPNHPPLDLKSKQIRKSWKQIKADTRRALLVAEVGGRLVGTADCVIIPNLTHGGRPYITVENMVVDASHRRRGVGAALIAAVIAEARQAGCYKIQLLSNRQRIHAHKFYEAVGFSPSAQGYRMYL